MTKLNKISSAQTPAQIIDAYGIIQKQPYNEQEIRLHFEKLTGQLKSALGDIVQVHGRIESETHSPPWAVSWHFSTLDNKPITVDLTAELLGQLRQTAKTIVVNNTSKSIKKKNA